MPPGSLAAAVRAEVRGLERRALVAKLGTMKEALDGYSKAPRATSILVGAFAVLALVLAAMGLLGRIMHGVDPGDALIWVAAPLVLALVALAACAIPARRAAALDPAAALRRE